MSERDALLDEIVTGYLQAVAAGQAPNRQAVLDAHPSLADELNEFFTTQDQIHRLASPLRLIARAIDGSPAEADTITTVSVGDSEPAAGQPFGNYELLDKLGAGGMGVVYRARQKGLNRLVALKIVRAGELASGAEVQRFRHEAETVALLDHPNIVPVHEVGEHAGQLYFSMKLLEGGSLARRIGVRGQGSGITEEVRDQRSEFSKGQQREAAQLVATVARAVHYAHQRGVLHRDLKPSNILLDVEGRPHVADFGLAKRLEKPADLTRTDAVVGTPSYMAPEQAGARKGAVTTAADVYGVGAILYFLLTGRPPFQADTTLAVIDRVRNEEPPTPSSINRRIDRDLETICLKCLEKEPGRRYASAEAVADDMERWLTGQPILARRVGPLDRLWRWVRRNPIVAVLLIAVVLLLAITAVTLAVSTLQTRAALKDEAAQRQRAERHYHKAREAVDQMLMRVGLTKLAAIPQMEPVRRQLLEDARRFYEDFLKESGDDPDLRADTARTELHLAAIYQSLANGEKTESSCQRALHIFQELAAEAGAKADYRPELAECYRALAGYYFGLLDRNVDAEQAYNQALPLLEGLVADFPDRPQYRGDLANTLGALGRMKVYANQRAQAEPLLRRAVAMQKQLVKECTDVADYQDGLAITLSLLGEVLLYTGRERAAVPLERQAVERLTKLTAAHPTSPEYREHLGEVHQTLAGALRELGQLEEAVRHYRQSLVCRQKNARDFPTLYDYQHRVTLIQTDLARALVEIGHRDEAEQAYREALSLLEQLIRKSPSLPFIWWDCQNCRKGLADLLYATGRTVDATRVYQQIVTDYTRHLNLPAVRGHALNDLTWLLATCPNPQVRDIHRALSLAQEGARLYPEDGRFINTLGVVYYRAGHYRKAIATLEKSRKLLHYQADSYNTFFLAMACCRLGEKKQAHQWYGLAVQWMEQYQPHGEEMARFRAEAAKLLGIRREREGKRQCPASSRR